MKTNISLFFFIFEKKINMRLNRLMLMMLFVLSCSSPQLKHRNVFRYNESKGITSLDPAYARSQTNIWPVNQLFNGLVQMDDSLNVQPCIAKSWNISPDALIYTFNLRTDVYFHDDACFPGSKGRKVLAKDFVYSFKRIIDENISSPGSWIFKMVNNPGSDGFEAVNDSLLRIHLKNPFPGFLGLICMQYCSVIPVEAILHYQTDFGRHPIGTGPFCFKTWKDGEKLVLLRNPKYFEVDDNGNHLPYLDAINITFIRDKQSEFLEFVKGNIDILSGVQTAYKDELITRDGKLASKYAGRFKMLKNPYLNTEYLGFLLDSKAEINIGSPLLIKEVRQAINYAIDKAKMMKYIRNNIGFPATSGFVPKGIPSFSEEKVKGFSYNPDKSRELLKKAGYPNGEGLPEITLTTTADYQDLCEYIQNELSQIGVKIKIEVLTGGKFKEMVAGSKLTFFRGSWVADYPDAENYLSLFISSNKSPKGPNTTNFSNTTFDSLYNLSLKEPNNLKRYKYYQEMDKIIIQEAPIVPLFYDVAVRFIPNNIEGLGINPMNLLTLKKTQKK
jgi:oligopeptide transport system substrate-binding protein